MDEEILNNSVFENELVYSQNVIEFVTVAGEYCGFSENASNFSRKDFIEKSIKLLPLLYLKSTLLPKTESLNDVVNEKFVGEHDWAYIKENVSQKLGSYDSFIDVSDTISQVTTELTSLSISECFADVYQDLKDFISLYQVGTTESMQDGLWECKMNFEQIWGQRILAILSNFHEVFFGENQIDEEDELTSDVNDGQQENAWVNTLFEKEEDTNNFDFS